jgi:hypothetical protein
LRWTVATIVVLGIVLDFVLGFLTLRFPGCGEPQGTGPYLWCLPSVRGRIPIEEVLFYAMGPTAMVLVLPAGYVYPLLLKNLPTPAK